LRYYDQEGLLSPSEHSEAGYRLYSDDDLIRLQQVLALKFLGFSLDEIRGLLRAGPQRLPDVLSQQQAMLRAKRAQLDVIIAAIDETAQRLQAGDCDWDSLIRVIQVIRMEQNKEWVRQYLTPEQEATMQEISAQAYSVPARARLAGRGEWTEADQARASAAWAAVGAEATRLTAAGADPAGAEAQALARQYTDLIAAFTGGDPEVTAGLGQWWRIHDALPPAECPVQRPYGPDEAAFIQRAAEAYRQQH